MFPTRLRTASGAEVDTRTAIDGKIVALYFSFEACPPCRQFTPKLAGFYNTMKAEGKNFEIIFVSADKDESIFESYHAKMPWLAIPYTDPARKSIITHKPFQARSFPKLVFLNDPPTTTTDILNVENWEIITLNGRMCVQHDPAGSLFPYLARSMENVFRDVIVSTPDQLVLVPDHKSSVSAHDLSHGNHTALVFLSPHIQNKAMTGHDSAMDLKEVKDMQQQQSNVLSGLKVMSTMRDTAKTQHQNLDIILVTGQSCECDYRKEVMEYADQFKDVNCWLLSWETIAKIRGELQIMFDVHFLDESSFDPAVVILAPSLSHIISKDAFKTIQRNPTSFPWNPETVVDFSHDTKSHGYSLDERVSMIAFGEYASQESMAHIVTLFSSLSKLQQVEASKPESNALKSSNMVCTGDVCVMRNTTSPESLPENNMSHVAYNNEPKVLFFTNRHASTVAGTHIRRLCKLDPACADKPSIQIVLLDFIRGSVYHHTGDHSLDALRKVIEGMNSDTLETKLLFEKK